MLSGGDVWLLFHIFLNWEKYILESGHIHYIVCSGQILGLIVAIGGLKQKWLAKSWNLGQILGLIVRVGGWRLITFLFHLDSGHPYITRATFCTNQRNQIFNRPSYPNSRFNHFSLQLCKGLGSDEPIYIYIFKLINQT